MSIRPFALALLALTLAAGCGEAPSDSAFFGMDLLVDRAFADQLDAFQVVVLPNSPSRNCEEIQKTCLRQQVKPDEPLVLRDAKGTESRALRFLANPSASSQDVVIEVPVGRNYALVIEALSKDTPPKFLGSSCTYMPEVNAGRNEPFLAATMTFNPVDCDPSF